MTFIIQNKWRIKSHDVQGFMVQKKVGNQWKEASYFNSLGQAASWLLERRVHHESTDIVINSTNLAMDSIQNARLVQLVDGIRDEIEMVLR